MAERITLTIIPPSGGRGELTVQDAMHQVLDAFTLMAGGGDVVWRLVSATTNSPLTIIAEADDSHAATTQLKEFSHSLAELQAGRFPEAWKRPELTEAASAFLRRSSLGVARTDFRIKDDVSISLTSEDAIPFLGIAESANLLLRDEIMLGSTKKQRGSIEGMLGEVTTHYGRPAIRIRERKTQREIICVITDSLARTFETHASIQDVWMKRRVTVKGDIYYRPSGAIARVEASDVVPMKGAGKELPSLHDPEFTGGLSAAEYLEKFRAGEIG
jgi:hypothetical protein